MSKIIVIGACGQIGIELVIELRKKYGVAEVFASDIKDECPSLIANGPYKKIDIIDREDIREFIISNSIQEVYLLAALLSATAEQKPDFAWKLNMEGLFNVLDLAKEKHINKVYWPSSIAVWRDIL